MKTITLKIVHVYLKRIFKVALRNQQNFIQARKNFKNLTATIKTEATVFMADVFINLFVWRRKLMIIDMDNCENDFE